MATQPIQIHKCTEEKCSGWLWLLGWKRVWFYSWIIFVFFSSPARCDGWMMLHITLRKTNIVLFFFPHITSGMGLKCFKITYCWISLRPCLTCVISLPDFVSPMSIPGATNNISYHFLGFNLQPSEVPVKDCHIIFTIINLYYILMPISKSKSWNNSHWTHFANTIEWTMSTAPVIRIWWVTCQEIGFLLKTICLRANGGFCGYGHLREAEGGLGFPVYKY